MTKKLLVFVCVSAALGIRSQAQNTFPQVGKVGIGTTIPSEQLEVIGDIRIDGLKHTPPPGSGNGNNPSSEAKLLRYVMVDNDGKLVPGQPEGIIKPIVNPPPQTLLSLLVLVAEIL